MKAADAFVRKDWSAHEKDIPLIFHPLMDNTMTIRAKQAKLAGVLVERLQEHGLFGTYNSNNKGTVHRVALSKKYPSSSIEYIVIRFNVHNVTFSLTDSRTEMRFGYFKYLTHLDEPISATMTIGLSFNNEAEQEMVDDLKSVFEETRHIYNNEYLSIPEYDWKSVDIHKIPLVDICTKWTGDTRMANKLIRAGYDKCTIIEFAKEVNFKELQNIPGIGRKTISVLRHMFIVFGLVEPDENK